MGWIVFFITHCSFQTIRLLLKTKYSSDANKRFSFFFYFKTKIEAYDVIAKEVEAKLGVNHADQTLTAHHELFARNTSK